MKLKNITKYIAVSSKVLTTVLILLLGLFILQFFVIETELMVKRAKLRATITEEEPNEAEARLDRIASSKKNFLPDGTIHLVHRPRDPTTYRKDKEQVYGTNDNLLWEGPIEDRPYKYLSWASSKFEYRGGVDVRSMREMQGITPAFSRALEVPVISKKKIQQIWRYNPDSEFFTGYNRNGDKIGYLGLSGFSASKSQAKPFGKFKYFFAWCPKESRSPTLLWQTNHRVCEINFEKQHVEVLFESEEENIKWVRLNKWGFSHPRSLKGPAIDCRPLIHCLTEDGEHHLIMRNPEEKRVISVPKDWVEDSVNLTAIEQEFFVYYHGTEERPPETYAESSRALQRWHSDYRRRTHKDWVEFYRVDDNGSLELLNRFDWMVPGKLKKVKTINITARTMPYLTKVSSPAYDLVWYLFGDLWLRSCPSWELMGGIEYSRPGYSIWNLVLSIVMMGYAFWHGWVRRTSRGKFIFWLVLVGTLNLAGLLAYLALNHTAVIRCPACGRRRGLERVDCVRCGVELPRPERRKLDLIFNT